MEEKITLLPPPPSPELPDLDKLEVMKVLGKGAMGTVFLTRSSSSARPFALKVVERNSSSTDSDRRARWEISVLRRLRHPSLPSLISSLETDTFIAWAIPYCAGGDLNALRRHLPDRTFSPDAIRFYAAQILAALSHLHSLSIVYRDLKPENVLIQSSGHVTLTDFDLSRTLAKPTIKTLIQEQIQPNDDHQTRRSVCELDGNRLLPVSMAGETN